MALSDVVPCDFCDEALNLTFCNDCFVRLCNECKTKHSGISLCKNLVPYKERKLNCTRVCNVHRKDESNILCKTCTLPICSSCLGRHKDHALIVRNELSTRRGKCLETLQYQFEEMKLMETSSNFTFELCSDTAKEIEKTLKDLLENDDQDNPVFAFELAGRNETECLRRENTQLIKENESHVAKISQMKEDNEREKKEYEKTLNENLKEIQRLRDDLALQTERRESVEQEFQKKQETIADIQMANKELMVGKETLTKEMEATISTVQRLEKERKELEDHIQKMTNEIKRQEVEIQDFARAYENQRTDNYNLNIQIDQISRSLEEQKRTTDKLQKRLSEEKKAKENALNSKEETTDVLQKANAELIREKDRSDLYRYCEDAENGLRKLKSKIGKNKFRLEATSPIIKRIQTSFEGLLKEDRDDEDGPVFDFKLVGKGELQSTDRLLDGLDLQTRQRKSLEGEYKK